MCIFYASLLALIYRQHKLSASLYSLAVSVKMNIALYSPAYAIIFLLNVGIFESIKCAINVIFIQILLGRPFLKTDAKAYVTSAFDLSRKFLFRWTVNWRFIPVEIFNSNLFAFTLLSLHVALLFIFAFYKWVPHHSNSSMQVLGMAIKKPHQRPLLKELTTRGK